MYQHIFAIPRFLISENKKQSQGTRSEKGELSRIVILEYCNFGSNKLFKPKIEK